MHGPLHLKHFSATFFFCTHTYISYIYVHAYITFLCFVSRSVNLCYKPSHPLTLGNRPLLCCHQTFCGIGRRFAMPHSTANTVARAMINCNHARAPAEDIRKMLHNNATHCCRRVTMRCHATSAICVHNLQQFRFSGWLSDQCGVRAAFLCTFLCNFLCHQSEFWMFFMPSAYQKAD